jgi:hypothetical protein
VLRERSSLSVSLQFLEEFLLTAATVPPIATVKLPSTEALSNALIELESFKSGNFNVRRLSHADSLLAFGSLKLAPYSNDTRYPIG